MSTVKTIHITHGGALALYNVLRDAKWYTELLDLMNAGAMAKLLAKKVPALTGNPKIPDTDVEAWMDKAVTLKINEEIMTTVKKCLNEHVKIGSFMGTPHVMGLFKACGVEFKDVTDDLLKLNDDDPPTTVEA